MANQIVNQQGEPPNPQFLADVVRIPYGAARKLCKLPVVGFRVIEKRSFQPLPFLAVVFDPREASERPIPAPMPPPAAPDILPDPPTAVTCLCTNCSARIEFEPLNAGAEVDCPSCGLRTMLYIPEFPVK
jgi:DNA-directed RNA polymerase subunit RPC12/RpoP